MFDNCISKNVIGCVPFSWSKLATFDWRPRFQHFPNFGLEMPADDIIYRDSIVTN